MKEFVFGFFAGCFVLAPSVAIAQVQTRQLSPAWLILKYGTKTGDDIEVLPMPDMDFCEVAGASWATSKNLYRTSKKGFTCIQGDYARDPVIKGGVPSQNQSVERD